MKSKFYFLTFILLITTASAPVSASSQGENVRIAHHQVSSFQMLASELEKLPAAQRLSTLVITDLDDTLFHQNFCAIYPDLAHFLKTQTGGFISATARDYRDWKRTEDQLRQSGMTFSDLPIVFNGPNNFQNGVLYTNNGPKGPPIFSAVQSLPLIQRVFLIDDDEGGRKPNIANIKETFLSQNHLLNGRNVQLDLMHFIYDGKKVPTRLPENLFPRASKRWAHTVSVSDLAKHQSLMPQSVVLKDASMEIPSPIFDLKVGHSSALMEPAAYSGWHEAYAEKENVVVFSSLRQNSLRRVLGDYFTQVNGKSVGDLNDAEVMRLSMWEHFLVRSRVCGSVIDLNKPETLKVIMPVGVLMRVPAENLFFAHYKDGYTAIEGGSQAATRKALMDEVVDQTTPTLKDFADKVDIIEQIKEKTVKLAESKRIIESLSEVEVSQSDRDQLSQLLMNEGEALGIEFGRYNEITWDGKPIYEGVSVTDAQKHLNEVHLKTFHSRMIPGRTRFITELQQKLRFYDHITIETEVDHVKYKAMLDQYKAYKEEASHNLATAFNIKTINEYFNVQLPIAKQLSYKKINMTPQQVLDGMKDLFSKIDKPGVYNNDEYNEVNYVPRVNDGAGVKEAEIIGFAIDSQSPMVLDGSLNRYFNDKSKTAQDYIRMVKELANELQLPLIDFADLRLQKVQVADEKKAE